ncbi:uncharacterized protein VTP21DRAFT_1372 [Calcarisporiella thermophila]|uniref:uncharacterized protein n=1 Tax=Calcarisporiella thermophila TaxID=911321 RepID=UPI003742F3C3
MTSSNSDSRSVAGMIFSLGMVIGPAFPLLDQYRLLLSKRPTRVHSQLTHEDGEIGFSIDSCGLLLMASLFRIFFWFGKRFDITLLWQSIVMIILQLLLLERCVYLQRPRARAGAPSIISQFWRWPRFSFYVNFLITSCLSLIIFYLVFGSTYFAVELLGFISTSLEASVPIPQALTNYTRKSTEGLSIILVVSNLLGDAGKTIYYFTNNSPLQFLVSGLFQVSVDAWIVYQVLLYSKPKILKA